MRILVWHVHGGWMDAFVRGEHEYVVPTEPGLIGTGFGAGGHPWPASVSEVAPGDLAQADVDVLVAQRLEELDLAQTLTGRRIGSELPTVFVEHNTPKNDVPSSRHPLADRDDLTIAHVTHFNALMWDTGSTRTTVVEHGVPDPGALYTGELARLGVVINEPVRRWRVTGTDLLPAFARVAPVDVFGIAAQLLPPRLEAGTDVADAGDLPADIMHAELARRRVYVHPQRWTSLGLSLLEAMHLGMPVIVLGTTEAFRAVPPEAGAISTSLDELVAAARLLVREPEEAARRGAVARRFALERYALPAFLSRWSEVLDDVLGAVAVRSPVPKERKPS